MNTELVAIASAMDKTGGRDRDTAARLAHAYVKAHPDEFTDLKNKTLPECVAAVDVFRAAGWEESRLRVEAWLLHAFEPQHIGGDITIVRPENG